MLGPRKFLNDSPGTMVKHPSQYPDVLKTCCSRPRRTALLKGAVVIGPLTTAVLRDLNGPKDPDLKETQSQAETQTLRALALRQTRPFAKVNHFHVVKTKFKQAQRLSFVPRDAS